MPPPAAPPPTAKAHRGPAAGDPPVSADVRDDHRFKLAAEFLPVTPEDTGPYEVGENAPYTSFPGLYRVPIPNAFFDHVSELSGPAVQLAFLLAGVAYRHEEEEEKWTTSPRYWTVGELREAYGPTGIHGASLSRAIDELEDLGWIETTDKGRATGMRLLLSVEGSSGFTWTPYAYLRTLHRLSYAATKALLCVVRSTWGWTRREYENGERVYKHQERARLTNEELAAFCGLSVRACQSAAHELEAKGMAHRSRPHRGSAYFYELTVEDVAEKAANLFNTSPPTFSKSCGHGESARTRAREADEKSKGSGQRPRSHVKRGERVGSSGGSRTVEEIRAGFDEQEQGIYDILTGSGFDLRKTFVARQVEKWSGDVLGRTMRVFQEKRQEGDLRNPTGWMRDALKHGYFARRTENPPDAYDVYKQRQAEKEYGEETTPENLDRQRGPLASAFEGLVGKEEGWEWHDEADATEEADATDEADEDATGIPYDEMLEVIDALGGNDPLSTVPGGWDCHEQDGEPNTFTPNRTLARWAWAYQDDGTELFQRAANKVLDLWAEVSEWDR